MALNRYRVEFNVEERDWNYPYDKATIVRAYYKPWGIFCSVALYGINIPEHVIAEHKEKLVKAIESKKIKAKQHGA